MRFLHRLLLLAFPKSFRQRHGRDLVQAVLDDCRTKTGRLSPLRVLAASPEIVRAGLAERAVAIIVPAGDVRLALRRWRRRPGFAITAILTLALGIGATTSIFSVVDAVVLRPLPWPDPDRLVVIHGVYPDRRQNPAYAATWNRGTITCSMWDAIRSASVFQDVAVWRPSPYRTTLGEGRTEIVPTTEVSSNFFRVLGASIVTGPGLTDQDDRTATHTALLPDETWRRRFGARTNVVGETLGTGVAETGGRTPRTIVGVVEPGFRFEANASEFFFNVGACGNYDGGAFRAIARLADGVSVGAAESEANARVRVLGRKEATTVRLVPQMDDQFGQVAKPLWMMFDGAVLLLLVACSNVAGLLLGDARMRRHEMGVRVALGGSRGRLVRQLAVEYGLLGLVGTAIGLLAAFQLTGAIVAVAPAGLPRIETVAIDLRVALLAIALGVSTVLLFGLAPALSLARTPAAKPLAEGRWEGAGRRLFGHRAVVAAQMAIALVLLAATALFGETIFRLTSQPLDFNPANLAVVSTTYTGKDIGDPAVYRAAMGQPNFREVQQQQMREAFSRRVAAVTDRLLALPGVTSAAATTAVPFLSSPLPAQVRFDRQPEEDPQRAWLNIVTDSYFTTMGIGVLSGRSFEGSDRDGTALVAVVSQQFEKQLLGQDAVGRRFNVETGPRRTFEVVGVVADIDRRDRTSNLEPVFYSLDRQTPWGRSSFIVRTSTPSETMLPLLRRTISEINPQVVVTDSTTMDALMEQVVANERFRATLAACFGGAALLLATIGLYGLAARRLADRRREFAVRVALGAAPANIGGLIFRDALIIVGAGLLAGLPAAYAASQLTRTMLFGVSPDAPHVFLLATGVLVLAALAATFGPVRRASRLDPVQPLKE